MSSESSKSDTVIKESMLKLLQDDSVGSTGRRTVIEGGNVVNLYRPTAEQKTQNIHPKDESLDSTPTKKELIDLHDFTKPILTENDFPNAKKSDPVIGHEDAPNKVLVTNSKTMQSVGTIELSVATNRDNNIEQLSEAVAKEEVVSSEPNEVNPGKDICSTSSAPCIKATLDPPKLANEGKPANPEYKTTWAPSKMAYDDIYARPESKPNQSPEIESDSSTSDQGNSETPPFSKIAEIPSEDSLDSIIPQKIQVGFRNVQVGISSIDSKDVFTLCGTNAGCGYLYNRETGHLMKLACEARHDVVKTVKLFIGIECQCALGTTDGKILIIIVSSGSAPNTRRVQKFTLGAVHSAEVTCLEWSANGMKLFSGDKNGNVHVIERDFEKNQCHASSLLKEGNEIVDLAYKHKVLLISTTERSLLFNASLPDSQKIPIGSKTRQGVYGACFGPDSSTTTDLQIYCARPGYRIWIADVEGKVTKTLLFKHLITSLHSEIKLIDSTRQVIQKDNQFRRLMFFQEKYLLALSDCSIFIIDPSMPSVLASCQNFDELINSSITRNEIFVLCKNRKIHRISEERDELAYKRKRLEEENMSEAMKKLQSMKNSFTASFSLQALQSKMSSINEEAEQWSSKLHSQAKSLQQKLPTIGTSLFSRDGKTESSDQHCEAIAMATTSSQISSDSKLRLSETETEKEETKKDLPVIDCESIKQDKDLEDQKPEHSPTSVNLHFEKIKEIGNQETNEIVFQSKRKRTKSRSPSFRHHSDLDESQKSPSKTVNQGSTESQSPPDSSSNSEDILNINGAHVPEEYGNDVLSIAISPETVEKQDIKHSTSKSPDDHHDQESVPENFESNNIEIPVPVIRMPPLSHNPHGGDHEAIQSDQIEMSTTNSKEDTQEIGLEATSEVLELIPSENVVSPEPSSPQNTHKESHSVPIENTKPSTEAASCKEGTRMSQESPLLPSTQTLNESPRQEQIELNSEVARTDSQPTNSNPVKLFPNGNTSSNSKFDSSCELAESSDDGHSLASSSDDIYAVDTATRDFESELDSEDDDSFKDTPTDTTANAEPKEVAISKTSVSRQQYEDKTSVPAKLHDSWSTTSLPHRVSNISASGNFIWFIDHFNQIYLAEEFFGDAAIKWKKFEKTGTKLCISPSGDIMWCLGKSGTVYAGVMPTELHLFEEPLNFYWQKVTSNISCIALGHGNAWVLTNDGVIKSQLDLSRSKFYAETWNLISWPQNNGKVVDIAVSKTMVWCRTDHNGLYRSSIEDAHEGGAAWEQVLGPKESTSAILNMTSDGRDTIFVIDARGVMSFLSEDGKLWQVNVSEFMDEEQHLIPKSFVQSLPQNVATSVHKVQRWAARPIEGQFIAVSNQSIWIVHNKYMAAVAKGPITGHRWDSLTPLGVSKSSKWRRITTSSIFSPDLGSWVALVWASRPNGEIFCFSSQDVAKNHPLALPPATLHSVPIVCMSACKDALWVLYENGEIYIRSGITASRLQGTEWSHLDTKEQLGDVKITHISCGTQHVWAVGSEGQVYFRFGVGAVDGNSLPPAWIPVDGCDITGRHFTQVECGLSDSSIWAIDNYSEIYVRTGVSVDMPIGTKWEVVPGSHAHQICISNHTVWGLRTSGNLIRRFGISQRNQMGNYWKKVIGRFTRIAATPYDELWAIDEAEQLRHLSTNVYCPIVVEAQYRYDDMDNYIDEDFSFPENLEKDWEFV